jgi:hypothetical protein
MSHNKTEIRLLKLSSLLPIVFILIPYLFIGLLGTWQTRWFFGLMLFIFLPFVPLFIGLTPKFRLTNYDPKELPKNRYILRHLGIVVRAFLLFIGFGSLFYVTPTYIKSSIQLISKGWQPDHVIGTLIKFQATAPKNIVLRDIYLKETDRKLSLIYPLGKRLQKGTQYEFLVLPSTDIVVEIKEYAQVADDRRQ